MRLVILILWEYCWEIVCGSKVKGALRAFNGFMKRSAGLEYWRRTFFIADFLYPSKFYMFFKRIEMSYVSYEMPLYCISLRVGVFTYYSILGRHNRQWVDAGVVGYHICIRDSIIH